MLCAIVNDNKITEIKEISIDQYMDLARSNQLVLDITDANPMPVVGLSFDGNSIVFPGNIKPKIKISRLAFFDRFTTPELQAFYSVAAANSAFAIMRDKLMMATYIDLNRDAVNLALTYLVAANVLTSERKATILTTSPTYDELYKGIE